MAKRLVEIYQPGDEVLISFDGEEWFSAQVVNLQYPGVWVQTENGRFWFVTNTQHIKPKPQKNS